MLNEKERLTKILYYADISPNSKQFIQDLINKKNDKIVQLNRIRSSAIEYVKKRHTNNYIEFENDLLNILRGDE